MRLIISISIFFQLQNLRQQMTTKNMNSLQQLSENIVSYNLIGLTKLSNIKLSIIYKKKHKDTIDKIMDHLKCQQNVHIHNLMGLKGYSILKSQIIKGIQLHLFNSLQQDEDIQDEYFVKRKKIFQKLTYNKEMIFCYLQPELQRELQIHRPEVLQLKRMDPSVHKNIQWKNNMQLFDRQIIKIWESINRYDIIKLLKQLKEMMKMASRNKQRQAKWLSIYEGKADNLSYAFQLVNISKEYIVCSLQGFYSSQASNFNNYYSIHWQIMDIFEDLWKEQSQKINKQLQKMPLSYIQQTLKMNDYNSIGGFLPEACFLKIYKPILDAFADNVIISLEAAKYKVLQNTQMIYQYYFTKTSVKQSLIQLQLKNIEDICNNFLNQVQNAINSQINYVYAPAQSFWQMRNIRSSLYSQEQQANIQVKYIGKVYVKRVFESIRQSIPRFIGHSLLRKVSKYIKQNGLNNFLQITKEIQFSIILSSAQIDQIKINNEKMHQYYKLYNYFSLKVSSTFKIKNLLQKTQQRWRQMYKHSTKQNLIEQDVNQTENSRFTGWFKRLFSFGKKQKKEIKRSKSSNKWNVIDETSSKIQENKIDLYEPFQTQRISQKTWILLINTNKKIDDYKLFIASCHGFPQKLRPSIWYWFAKRQNEKQIKLVDILIKQKLNLQITKQIEKDLGRTPPKQLFVKKLRSNLRDVLQAYSLIDEQIQYTQGMNFLTAIVLSVLTHWGIKDDYLNQSSQKVNSKQINQKALTLLIFLMKKQGFGRVMKIQRQYIAEICDRIDVKIKQHNIKIWDMIQQSGFNCELIFGPLLISGLLTWSSNIEINRRIMDIIICRGFSVLYKIVALIVAMSQEQLTPLKHQQIYDFLRNKCLDIFFEKVGHEGLTQLFYQL